MTGDHELADEWDDDATEWRAGGVTLAGPGGEGEPDPVDPDHLAAVRTIRMIVAAAALAVLGLVAVLLAGALDDGGDDVAEDPVVLGGDAAVGPAAGTLLAGYVIDRNAVLATADGEQLAVVSLVSYRGADAVDDLLDDAGVEVVATLVALPGGEAAVTTDPLARWVEDQRAPLQDERDEIAGLLPTIEDPNDPFIAGYTDELARLDAQLAGLDPAADLVFGAVVRADAERLRALGARPEVRLVDLGPDDTDPAAVAGLRPEELEVAGQPPARPT